MEDRNLTDVIDQLLDIIPEEEECLRSDLIGIKRSAEFASPEMMRHWWLEGANVLLDNIPGQFTDWEKKVANIWLNKEDGTQS